MGLPEPFGEYSLLTKIATGGMAETFLARRTGDDAPGGEFVVKRILPQLSEDPTFIERFRQEASVAASLDHPNIARVFQCGQSADGETFIAMEYIWGEDLRRIAERGMTAGRFLSIQQAVKVCAEVANALAAVHEQADADGAPLHLVHRDVSPPNIMVGFDGGVRLVDFGIALFDSSSAKSVRQGQLQGKFGYMSPEQVEGLEIDHRSDIFSLGTVLYEFTTRKRLFKGENDLATMKVVAESKVRPPSESLPSYPPELERIVLKALAGDRKKRFSTAAEMRDALLIFIEQQGDSVESEELAQYMRRLFPDRMDDLEALLGSGYEGPSERAAEMAFVEQPVVEEPPEEEEKALPTPPPAPAAAVLAVGSAPEIPDPEAEPLDLTDLATEETPAEIKTASHTLRKARLDKFEKAAERSNQLIVVVGLIVLICAVAAVWYGTNYSWPWEGRSTVAELPDVEPLPARQLPATIPLQVSSNPVGAAVAANGVIGGEVTPTTVEVVPNATNTLVFYLDGYQTLAADAVATDTAGPVTVTLAPVETPEGWVPPEVDVDATEPPDLIPRGQLQVSTDPAGATVLLNGQEACQSPCRLTVTAGQEQHILVRRFGHLDTISHATAIPFVNENDTRFLHLELRPTPNRPRIYTFFQLDSYPERALVTLNDTLVGETPLRFQRELDSLYRVEISSDDFEPWARSFYPATGRFELRPLLARIERGPVMYTLHVDAPDMPGTRIYLGMQGSGAREVGRDLLEALVLDAGEYELTLSYTPPRESGLPRLRTEVSLDLPAGQHVVERYGWTGNDFALLERTTEAVTEFPTPTP